MKRERGSDDDLSDAQKKAAEELARQAARDERIAKEQAWREAKPAEP